MKCTNFDPYEGSENYIFISYAHKNAEEVSRLLDRMHEAGYRIWYDDGIAPGSEWPEYIAHHLNQAAVCLALVSPESIASANCRREITYALSKQKPFLGVFLEKTELSPGMELQLSAQQCILRYNYADDETFYKKVIDSEILASCRTVLVAPVLPEQETKVMTDGPSPITPEDMSAVEQMASVTDEEAVPAKKAKKTKKAKSKKEKHTESSPEGSKKKRKKWILPAIAGILLLLLALPFLSSKVTDVKIAENKVVSIRSTYLTLQDMEITSDTIKKINKLKKITSLTFENCSFTGDLSSYKRLPELNVLTIDHCSGISDLSFVYKLTNVSELTLIDAGVTDEIGSFDGFSRLKAVNFSENAGFTDLTLLPLGQITQLNISDTGVTDISALSEAASLKLFAASNCAITDGESLVSLTMLETLDLSGTQIDHFSKPLASLSIKHLNLEGTKFSTTEAFDNLTILTYLNISDTAITEAPCLKKSKETMTAFEARNVDLTGSLYDTLEDCIKITSLDISGAKLKSHAPRAGATEGESVTDLRFATYMTGLVYVRAERCGLTSLNGLENKPNLKEVLLKDNEIADISDLNALKNYAIVDLRDNAIEHADDLPVGNYTILALCGNPLDPNSVPAGEKSSYIALCLDYQNNLSGSKLIKAKVSYWYLVNVPADQQLKLGDQLGSYKTHFVTADEFASLVDTHGMDPYSWH